MFQGLNLCPCSSDTCDREMHADGWILQQSRRDLDKQQSQKLTQMKAKSLAFAKRCLSSFNSPFYPNLQGATTTWDLLFSQCISELKYQENINYCSISALQVTSLRHLIKTLKTNLSKCGIIRHKAASLGEKNPINCIAQLWNIAL